VGYRQLKLFDEPFPTWDQMLSGDPGMPPFPKESWRKHVRNGEFALHFKHFQTGLFIGADGKHLARQDEYCRLFDSAKEAEEHAKAVCHEHPAVTCVIYDSSGAFLKRIYNRKKLTRSAIQMWIGSFFWLGTLTLAGLALAAVLYFVVTFILGAQNPTRLNFPWYVWVSILTAAVALGLYGFWTGIKWKAKRRVAKLQAAISPEEREYFEQLNTLYGSAERAERERFLKIRQEFLEKARRTLSTSKKLSGKL
jgi:hypothetical protein